MSPELNLLPLISIATMLADCGGGGGTPPPMTYTIGGTISGLAGTEVLQNNGGDNLTRTINGSFSFTTALADAAAYSVTVFTQPTGQTCNVASGSGNVAAANVTTVVVTCTAPPPITATDDPLYVDQWRDCGSYLPGRCRKLAICNRLI